MTRWIRAFADALEMRSPYGEGYVAGVIDALISERNPG